ncbi:MAG: hypothetical protein ACI4KG_04035 [Oscillospiraceae bacterium]
MIIENCTDIKEKPRRIQQNFSPVEPQLEEFINDGKECCFDRQLYNSFSNAVAQNSKASSIISVILKAFGIVVLASDAILVIIILVLIFSAEKLNKDFFLSILPPAIFSLLMLFVALLIFRSASKEKNQCEINSLALKAAETGQAVCRKYRCYQILRYTYYDGESTTYKYYADLHNFTVELPNPSEKWGNADFVYGVVTNIKGESYFILFNDNDAV